MRKRVFSILLALSLLFSCTIFVNATEEDLDFSSLSESELEERFQPYQDVLDQVNEEYNTQIQIADPLRKVETYRKVLSKTLDEFRSDLEEYIAFTEELSNIADENGVIHLDSSSVTYSVQETRATPLLVYQYAYLERGGGIRLSAYKSWHPTQSYAMYSSINSVIGVSDSDGWTFGLSDYSYSLKNNSRQCDVTVRGIHSDPSGFTNTAIYTYSTTFYASGA